MSMQNVIRMNAEPKTQLIKYIEDNFDTIEEFVVIFKHGDGTLMSSYESESFLHAVGMVSVLDDTLKTLCHEDTFFVKKKSGH